MIDLVSDYTKLIVSKNIKDCSKIVYYYMLSCAYNQITCFPSIKKIAEETGKSTRTIDRALAELRKYGLIRVYRANKKTKEVNNQYIIMPIEWVDLETVYTDEEVYIKTEKEYLDLQNKLRCYFEESASLAIVTSKDLTVAEVKPKRKKPVVKTLDLRVEALLQKLEQGKALNSADICVIFAKHMKSIRNREVSISNPMNNAIMRKRFSGWIYEDIDFTLETFVKDYKNMGLENEIYSDPSISSLGQDWIFNKLLSYVERKKRYGKYDKVQKNNIIPNECDYMNMEEF